MRLLLPGSRWLVIAGVMIGFVALLTRFYLLAEIPTSLAHDEMIYVIHAQSLLKSGTDLTGTWNPWSLTPMHPLFAELPTIFMAPFFALPVPPEVAARLPFALMSLILPFVLGGIAHELFRDRRITLSTIFLALFNPWIWQFGRMSFDAYWSLFFYSLGAYLLVRLPRLAKIWSIVPFFIGFYQYQGHKLGFIPWVVFFCISLATQAVTKDRKQYKVQWRELVAPACVFAFSCILFLFYAFVQLPQQSSSTRLNTLVLPSSPHIAEMVNTRRRLSIQTPLTSIGINKLTVWGEEIARKYAEAYKLEHLFLRSQFSGFNVWSHGVFYLADAVLILFGLFTLWKNSQWRNLGLLGFGLALTAVSAVVGYGDSFVFRASLSLPFLLWLAAVGAAFLWSRLSKTLLFIAAAIYLLGIAHFAFEYFVRYPVYAAQGNYFSDKILAEYVRRVDPSRSIRIYTPEPHFTYTALLFYNNILDRGDITSIQHAYKDETFVLDNLQITRECVPPFSAQDTSTVHVVRFDAEPCEEETVPTVPQTPPVTPIAIGAVEDSRTIYRITGDPVCKDLELPSYLNISRLNSFSVKSLDQETFCQTWLMDTKVQKP